MKPMVLSIKVIFEPKIEGHYPQENSFHHQSRTHIALDSTESNQGLASKRYGEHSSNRTFDCELNFAVLLERLERLKEIVQG